MNDRINSGDPRAYDLEWRLKELDANHSRRSRPISDPGQSHATGFGSLSDTPRLCFGRVWDTIAFLHCYRVALDGGQTVVLCDRLQQGATNPYGAREVMAFAPGTPVLVLRPPRSPYGTILGAMSPTMLDGSLCLSDYFFQGSRTGLITDKTHSAIFQLDNAGSLFNFGNHSPVDSVPVGEWGYVAETGLKILMDPYMVQMAVDEMTGVFGFYADQLLRISGYNLQERSAMHDRDLFDDEGELNSIEGWTPYFWERMGSLKRDGELLKENAAEVTQESDPHYAAVEPANDRRIPFYRHQVYRGYLGQGEQRFVAAPPSDANEFLPGESAVIPGLFHDHLSITGQYTASSAKGFLFVKRPLIPIPRINKRPEDPTGDTNTNYKAAGVFGSGQDHKVKADLTVNDPDRASMTRAAGVLDLMANILNWEGAHPFAYHLNDWRLPEEGDLTAMGGKDFGELNLQDLATKTFLKSPEPIEIEIDERLGKVKYYANLSYIGMLDDGGVVIGDGSGSEIRMAGGNIVLAPAGDLLLQPGRNVNMLAGHDVIMRAKNSIDLSATTKDVRIKSEGSCQIVAGNSGVGGILLESKGTNVAPDFINVQGEDAIAAGVMIKTADTPFAVLSRDIYLKANLNGEQGNVTIDAGDGGAIYTNCRTMHNVQDFVTHDFKGKVNQYSSGYASFCSDAGFSGWVNAQIGLFVGSGGLFTTGQVASPRPDGLMSVLSGRSYDTTITGLQESETTNTEAAQLAQESREAFEEYWEGDGRVGNSDVIQSVGFSFRTPAQYKTNGWQLLETRWQMLARKFGSSEQTWEEKPVAIVSGDTYPYPGKEKWADEETFFEYNPSLYDLDARHSKPRGDGADYQEPRYGDTQGSAPNGKYITIV